MCRVRLVFAYAIISQMPNKATLYPIYALADTTDRELFDTRVFPFRIVDDVAVEDVKPMFNPDTFAWVCDELGRHDLADLQRVQYAIVHRYTTNLPGEGCEADMESEKLVRNLVACLRLVRPMRQRTSLMRGEVGEDGKINVQHFEHPRELLEVPEVQKLFQVRNADLDLLRTVANEFLRAMGNEFWKFRMAVQFHEAGHFQDWYWKARYSLWCSALEALFTSQSREHQGSLVAKERIKWFLGERTSIYDPGDIPNFIHPQPNITVGAVVDDLYTVRNFVAHGDRVPDRFFQRKREGVGEELSVLQVLTEALSFIIRKTMLRILQGNLLQHFADAASSEAYFGTAGLTKAAIRQKEQQP
jgi:hypothetical protein